MYDHLISTLRDTFADAILETTVFRNEFTALVKKESIKAVCLHLRDTHGFNFCNDICGADRFTEDDRFEVIYNITNLDTRQRIRVKVRVDESDCVVESVTSVWKGADWNERETFDMYGIKFSGHPDLRRMYMPEDFEYFPLRKDFPLIGVAGSIPLPEVDPNAQQKEAAERFNNRERI
jgi:NADH-quinone oxidoreductase subunit C